MTVLIITYIICVLLSWRYIINAYNVQNEIALGNNIEYKCTLDEFIGMFLMVFLPVFNILVAVVSLAELTEIFMKGRELTATKAMRLLALDFKKEDHKK